jgi:hypothetical protein
MPTLLRRAETNPGGTTWCGPAAITAVTEGISYEEAAAAINRGRGKAPGAAIKGAYTNELQSALALLGYRTRFDRDWKGWPNTTLNQWVRRQNLDSRGVNHIVIVTGHFVAVRNSTVSDNAAKAHISKHPARRKHVKQVLQVWKEGTFPPTLLVVDADLPKPKPHYSSFQVRAWVRSHLDMGPISVAAQAKIIGCEASRIRSAIDWHRKQGTKIVSLGGGRFALEAS